jgi:RNA polymerase sigma-70 factor (ECF subfamily)
MSQSHIPDDDVSQLLKDQIAAGNEKAFRTLFDLFSARLVKFADAIIKNNDTAMEIVDDVFIKVWKQKEAITSISNLKVYLYTGVKNTALNYLSKKANQLITEPFDFMHMDYKESVTPEQELINGQILHQINQAIDSLPPRCKMIFKLVRQDGLKYKEVATILNISENTVDAQMVIAVKRVSEKVSKYFTYFPGTVS